MEAILARFGQSTEYVPHLKVGGVSWVRCCARDKPLAAHLQTILDSSSSPYAQYMAITGLLKLATEHSLTCVLCLAPPFQFTDRSLAPCRVQMRTEMKHYFLAFLDRLARKFHLQRSAVLDPNFPADARPARSKGPLLQHFVVVQLVQLLCRTVKLGWFDHDSHRSIVDDCKALMDKNSQSHYLLALRILNTLVQVDTGQQCVAF